MYYKTDIPQISALKAAVETAAGTKMSTHSDFLILVSMIEKKMKEVGIENKHSYAYYLNGKTGAETIEPLKKIIASLKDDVDEDYWKATEGNAKRALCGLLAFAQMRPDGVWRVC